MKSKFLVSGILLLASCYALSAQRPATKWFTALQGGVSFSINENCAGFYDKKRVGELFQPMGAVTVGYYFSPRIGARLQFDYGLNISAANYRESNNVLQPYTFQSFHSYVDVVLNGGKVDVPKNFNWRFFAGVGYAGSFGFSVGENELKIPVGTYTVKQNNNCFSFRFGFNLEYIWNCGVGLFFEGGHEWMTDMFNGHQGTDETGKHVGFPLDSRLVNQIGVSYHF